MLRFSKFQRRIGKQRRSVRHKFVKTTRLAPITAAVTLALNAHAGEIGHFNGGILNIRDYVMPDAGLYGAVYNYFYTTGQINNANGDASLPWFQGQGLV